MSAQKILIRRPGGYRRLELVEFDPTEPGPEEVLVETTSIGVNFADVVVRIGLYPSAKEYVGWPITPGFEFAGRVLRVGAAVTKVSPGDAAFGVVRFGAYASRITVDQAYVFPLPKSLDLATAGGFPVAHLTGYYALHELGRVQSGQTILVHSAAGAVGSALVRLGKAAGARVIGVVGSSRKVEAVRALGADVVIDKSSQDLWGVAKSAAPKGVDVALDANGYETLRGSYSLLRPTGRLVIYGAHSMLSRGSARPNWLKLAYTFLRTPRFDPLRLTNENKGVLGFNLSYLFEEKERLTQVIPELTALCERGAIGMPETMILPLREAPRSHELLQSGNTIGKLILAP